jgi:hypothetical protein
MVTSPYKWNILEQDVIQYTINQSMYFLKQQCKHVINERIANIKGIGSILFLKNGLKKKIAEKTI